MVVTIVEDRRVCKRIGKSVLGPKTGDKVCAPMAVTYGIIKFARDMLLVKDA